MFDSEPIGAFHYEDGLEWYKINNYDLLDPFLINVISSHDQWLFVSSSGALTAGRGSAENALFPYETEDHLHRNGGRTGPFTLIRVDDADEVWAPFATHTPPGRVHRSIAKTSQGDRLRFEEHNPHLGMTFRYTWSSAPDFGLIRTCELWMDSAKNAKSATDIELLDGLTDILPAGVELSAQQTSSPLVDAYRRSEYDVESGLALYTLEALVSDQPEPAESLSASVVFSLGLDDVTTTLSDRQIRRFQMGEAITPNHLVTGRKGVFLLSTRVHLSSASPQRWMIVADVGQDHQTVARRRRWLRESTAPQIEVRADEHEAHKRLVELVAVADAEQQTEDRRIAVHHYANVMNNCMRGGIPVDSYRLEVADFSRFVMSRNRSASTRLMPLIKGASPIIERDDLYDLVAGDVDLTRLVDEYLPLTFSRRHGDPSRPWNSFSIGMKQTGRDATLAYEGNWRDIFQNWEALIYSFPGYAMAIVAKFLNASTIDGYNPLCVTSEGIDWEMPDEGTWSHFGYWGDHQIVYLHRLLEAVHRFHPGLLENNLHRIGFSYANVPYRIMPYSSLVKDPKRTLEFDSVEQAKIDHLVSTLGMDGKLIIGEDAHVHHASLTEKLLVPALAKLSNLVPDGGIWLNTQRPEWNDANNALVGNGVSVVTVFYLRGYLAFVDSILANSPIDEVPVGRLVLEWLRGAETAFMAYSDLPTGGEVTPAHRRDLLDRLGTAFSEYRARVYGRTPGSSVAVKLSELRRFLNIVRPHLDHVVATAFRSDGLVDTYRLLRLESGVADIEPLYLMLEGQVAALNSHEMDPGTAIELVDNLYDSDIYRPDQNSFMLYPDNPPYSFIQKNRIPATHIGHALESLIQTDTNIVYRDDEGAVRFASNLRCAQDLIEAVDGLPVSSQLDAGSRFEVLEAYETVFKHRAFTGRSQAMYRYEGLGSVYWHMVVKLLLALQERLYAAVDTDASPDLVEKLIQSYRKVRAGLGDRKTVADHGAFPLDPHSHTPANSGAQQPGMTGTAKDGILIRWGELGVRIEDGRVRFLPLLLDGQEFLRESRPWAPLGPGQVLEADTLGFTYCGVPVIYHRHDETTSTKVTFASGTVVDSADRLDRNTSKTLFARNGAIARIDVWLRRL